MPVLRSVQVLRGIAALAVVVCHAATTGAKHGILVPLDNPNVGEWGVDIFFVISGFIMTFITVNHEGTLTDTLTFWQRRVLRIVPLYWLVSAFVLLNALLGHSDYEPTVDHVVASFLFIPWTDVRGVLAPVLRVGWSLNFEMYFYLVFGLILLLRHRLTWLVLWATVSILLGLIQPTHPVAKLLTSPLLAEFLMGVCIGLAYLRGKTIPGANILAVSAFATLIVLDLSGEHSLRAISFGIPAAVLVASGISLEMQGKPYFHLRGPLVLGDSSYSLYLTHVLTLAACGKLAEALHLHNPMTLVIETAIAVMVGYGCYRLIERPLHQRMTYPVALHT